MVPCKKAGGRESMGSALGMWVKGFGAGGGIDAGTFYI